MVKCLYDTLRSTVVFRTLKGRMWEGRTHYMKYYLQTIEKISKSQDGRRLTAYSEAQSPRCLPRRPAHRRLNPSPGRTGNWAAAAGTAGLAPWLQGTGPFPRKPFPLLLLYTDFLIREMRMITFHREFVRISKTLHVKYVLLCTINVSYCVINSLPFSNEPAPASPPQPHLPYRRPIPASGDSNLSPLSLTPRSASLTSITPQHVLPCIATSFNPKISILHYVISFSCTFAHANLLARNRLSEGY